MLSAELNLRRSRWHRYFGRRSACQNCTSARSERNQTTMAIKDDARTRAPRGTKNVTQAFFEALDGIPDNQQAAVATAALAGIRDEVKARRLKGKEAAARAKAKAPAKTKAPARAKAAPARKAKKAAPPGAQPPHRASQSPRRRRRPERRSRPRRRNGSRPARARPRLRPKPARSKARRRWVGSVVGHASRGNGNGAKLMPGHEICAGPASHSRNFDHRRRAPWFLTAMASALR